MRFSTFVVLALPAIAYATAVPRGNGYGGGNGGGNGGNNCNTGSLQCCNQVQDAKDVNNDILGGLLGISLGSITGLVGLGCTPISVIGVAGNSCSAQPVCCSDNKFGGLVSLGCNPINLNL